MLKAITPQSHLLELVQPKPDWRILIAAADNVSLAFVFAPYVSHVTLLCSTAEQAQEVAETAAEARISNIICDVHEFQYLPYADDSFDLLVCHHIAYALHNARSWLLGAARIICPQGLMVVTSYLVPGTRLRGKKARKLRESADYLNAFCQLHSPTHQGYYSQNSWEDLLLGAGFDLRHLETTDKFFDFAKWTDKASLTSKNRLRLKVMLIQAPEKAREFLTLQFSGDRIQFRLPEITILAKSKANTN